MHRPGAAEGQQGAGPAVDTAFHRHAVEGPYHGRVGDTNDAVCGFGDAHTGRLGDRLKSGPRRRRVETDRLAQLLSRFEVTQHQIRVGDRRVRTALSVAGRARNGARAVRPDFDGTHVEACDRAAAGADRLDRDHGLTQGMIAKGAVD